MIWDCGWELEELGQCIDWGDRKGLMGQCVDRVRNVRMSVGTIIRVGLTPFVDDSWDNDTEGDTTWVFIDCSQIVVNYFLIDLRPWLTTYNQCCPILHLHTSTRIKIFCPNY